MSDTVSFQQVIEYVEALSAEEQDLLMELIHKRRVEQRRQEIAMNAEKAIERSSAPEAIAAFKTGKIKRGTLAELRSDLLSRE
ncbi:MAG: hypothetical protein F6K58_05045 [Symploca sp. SIO2E9]|nr:hypothetical protein [Symploca sp. SIO2E9]